MPALITMGIINAIMLGFAILDQVYPGGFKQYVIDLRRLKGK